MTQAPTPKKIVAKHKSRCLELHYENESYRLPFVYLRVLSPDIGTKVAQDLPWILSKLDVLIVGLEPVGQYAIRIIFDDGHRSGIYNWARLYDLALNFEEYWQPIQAALGGVDKK